MWSQGMRVTVFCMVTAAMVGCQMPPQTVQDAPAQVSRAVDTGRLVLDLPQAWGGEVRCSAQGCLLGAVEHERNTVVVHRLEPNKTSRLLFSLPVLYHPDSATWLADDLLAAAVEDGAGVDIIRLVGEKLVKLLTVPVGFGPRDVVVVQASNGRYRLLATPYIGRDVAWIDWEDGASGAAAIRRSPWCKAPWHPVKVSQLPYLRTGGVAVACLDDRRVVAVSDDDLMAPPKVLATFNVVPRQARPSPSGRWLYVALETGERNARIDMRTGELQWLAASPNGSVSVAPLSDDLVVWGEDSRVVLQQLDASGGVKESKELATSGFSTSLQLLDVNEDSILDLIVLNSSGQKADVIYGPLWEKASRRP